MPGEDALQARAILKRHADVAAAQQGANRDLQSLTSWKGLACDLPASQDLLFWVRETLPDQFEAVLERAKTYA